MEGVAVRRCALYRSEARWRIDDTVGKAAKEGEETIVADGEDRLRSTDWYRQRSREVREEIKSECRPRIGRSGPVRGLWLEIKMWWEILKSTDFYYLAGQVRSGAFLKRR
jgi:hypothetical protein